VQALNGLLIENSSFSDDIAMSIGYALCMADTIPRQTDKAALATVMDAFPVTTILGPRQSGKTTLAHEFPANHFFDL
jgi:hypothetical protein